MKTTWIAGLIAVTVGAPSFGAGGASAAPAHAANNGQSASDPAAKATAALRAYRDEMVHPSPRPGPPYTNPRTHDYVMADITRKLAASNADQPTLKKAWETMGPGEVKDCLTIYFLLKGQADQKDAVVKYVLERKNPMRVRELGVEALGKHALKANDASVGRVLSQVIHEDAQGCYKGGANGSPVKLVFPVRRAAADAIKKMDKQGLLMESFVTAAAEHVQVEVTVPSPPAKK